ncbi:MAG: hypothetical protein H7Y06_08005 [Opitutaceae bacterium]|nr:hypothetical protein [Opitutaceae bacterium]
MKKTIIALAALAASVSASAQEAAKSSELAVTLDITYVSDYVFRGVKLADASIQPSIEAAYGDFYAGVWYSDATSQTNATALFDSEADLYAGYNLSINETFSADLGVTRYTYNGGSQFDSTEAFVGLKANVLLSPSVYYYYDFDLEVSSYIGSVGYSLPVEKVGLSLDFSATYGYIQVPATDYSYWGVGVAVPYKLSETAKLTGAVNYTSVDTSNLNPEQDQVVFSVGLSVGF